MSKQSKQYEILKKITLALIQTFEKEKQCNEATLKHNFFYYLKNKNPKYDVIVEENLKKHINFLGRADYYLDDKSKSYRNDVVIEFKVNCHSTKLIKHDLNKLDKIKKINPYIAAVFINVITRELNFIRFLKLLDLFYDTKSYGVIICPKVKGFFYKNKNIEIIQYELNNTTFIVNNARFIETHLIPLKYPIIRIPNKGGMTKKINLYKPNREQYSKNKFIPFCSPLNR